MCSVSEWIRSEEGVQCSLCEWIRSEESVQCLLSEWIRGEEGVQCSLRVSGSGGRRVCSVLCV